MKEIKEPIKLQNEQLREKLEQQSVALAQMKRELEIEAALERIRARTIAMQKSEELLETSMLLFQQFKELGATADQAAIAIVNEEEGVFELSATVYGNQMLQTYKPKLDDPFVMGKIYKAWKAKQKSVVVEITGEELRNYNILRNSLMRNNTDIPAPYKEDIGPEDRWIVSAACFSKGALSFSSSRETTKETLQIVERFAKVFEQTYTRFLDLQKAEAQAREAQIEAALERVRSQSMAMHKSSDLLDVISVLSDQLLQLGFKIDSANFNTSYREKDWNLWLCNPGRPMYPDKIHVPYLDHPYFNRTLESLANGSDFSSFVFNKEEKDTFLDHLFSNTIAKNTSEEIKKTLYSKPGFAWSVVYLKNTCVTIANYDAEPYTKEQDIILRRFGNAFEQSYTRFLDLQRAEAQAREAQIEAGLERVRSRTMAMQQSGELTETTKLLFEEFKKFQTEPDMTNLSRGFITTINEEKQWFDLWITDIEGNEIKQYFKIDFTEPTTGTHMYHGWKNKEPRVITDLQGEQLNRWLNYLSGTGFPVAPRLYNTRRINNFIYHSKGFIGITSSLPLTDESLRLLERFAKVFDLTYTRFVDLQNAETRALLAVQEASLDRVRAEIASMRTAEDLQHITPLVWRELTALGVPFFRCGVFIVDDEKQKIHFYLSAPDGKPLAALELGFDGAEVTQKATAHWREQKVYISHWAKEEFKQFAMDLVSQGQIQNVNTYQGGEDAPESLTLQFVPFAQGMMYVGSAEDLPNPQIELVQSLADAFSTAYARYEDFNKLEAAKQQVESAFKDLRATQTQLIQSEKMASLGELTAGIAHEIQNPLNFVNNFSEVSTELVDEMNEEIKKGNLADAQQIALDLKDNLSKINHHGKRAGDIVKGMLQHSRSSSGVKEPTDINALADEYLRLAYHGLRAKDKSFNATMKTDFDESIGTINIIPQDIGRVILNLITNAFYAVNTPQPPEGGVRKEPTVTISTKLITPSSGGRGVEIRVTDNGSGIPSKILDKIFQPFFTTKPTGQGTGLGLSLSYDIVKAHGGELKVETTEREGSTFIMSIPI